MLSLDIPEKMLSTGCAVAVTLHKQTISFSSPLWMFPWTGWRRDGFGYFGLWRSDNLHPLFEQDIEN